MGSPKALPTFDDEEFDFGGEIGKENGLTGTKRDFEDLEDDEEEELYPSKKVSAHLIFSWAKVAPSFSLHVLIQVRFFMHQCVRHSVCCCCFQTSLKMANKELEKWNSAFTDHPLLPAGTSPDPAVVVQTIQTLQASEEHLKEQLISAKRRESMMVVKLASTEQDIVELKSVVQNLKLMSKPPIQQAQRLLLDPAIHAEFTRMKKELEAAGKKLKELQDDLAAVQFTPHSKNGKLLMAKCRTLQDENAEIGREASEGKLHDLGTRLAMQKSLNVELRRCYEELYKSVGDVNEELERSQQMLYVLQRKLQQKEHEVLELRKQLDSQELGREEPRKSDVDFDEELQHEDVDNQSSERK
ncbi:unnamed protein product [Sphagnum balticum]